MVTKSRCIRSSALANPPGPLLLRPVFAGDFALVDWDSDEEEGGAGGGVDVTVVAADGRLCFGSCRKEIRVY